MTNAIGGFFEFELPRKEHYHKEALRLNTARNCFEYVLRAKKYTKIYMPLYTCEVLIEPLNKLQIEYEFYSVDNRLDPIIQKKLNPTEALLYTNYFGLKQKTVEKLAMQYLNLIIDNAQAFFSIPLNGIDTFYSARKFFGVSDGAYLYTDILLDEEFDQDYSFQRIDHLVKRLELCPEVTYVDFQKIEEKFSDSPILKMSKLTSSILSSLDYENIGSIRRANYKYLESSLGNTNLFSIELDINDIPMVYPYLSDNKNLRERLIESKIYIPTYWPNIFQWSTTNSFEYKFAKHLLPLPIDQRYCKDDMDRIIKEITKK